jgi:hypothetical protein
MEDYRSAVKSGFEVIPQVKEMESMLGEADHFITHYGMKKGPLKWTSTVFFAGRYQLSMRVNVELNDSQHAVLRVVSEPKFYLLEVVGFKSEGTERPELSPVQPVFGLADWNKLVEAKGDFSAIGITVHRDRPVKGHDEYAKGWRDLRERIRPGE